ncbi:hypothetical protein ACFYXC_40480 [Streptomyces sp. NPDC002701]|uniref:hypothetical protein n=1 Tax=Streptomyces sp. NPDC002701 TaxID=3364661 RepID=UPI0036C1B92F
MDSTDHKFNATHDDIKIKVVKQADTQGTAQNLRNMVAAGKDVLCLVENFGEVPGLVGEGLLTDIDEPLQPYLMMSTGAATIFLLGFVGSWNSFFGPLVFMRTPEK